MTIFTHHDDPQWIIDILEKVKDNIAESNDPDGSSYGDTYICGNLEDVCDWSTKGLAIRNELMEAIGEDWHAEQSFVLGHVTKELYADHPFYCLREECIRRRVIFLTWAIKQYAQNGQLTRFDKKLLDPTSYMDGDYTSGATEYNR